MALKVGDKVKFLNDVGGGVITRIKQQTVYVESSDGFEIPSVETELIKVEEAGFGGLKPEPVIPKNTKKPQPTTSPVIVESAPGSASEAICFGNSLARSFRSCWKVLSSFSLISMACSYVRWVSRPFSVRLHTPRFEESKRPARTR